LYKLLYVKRLWIKQTNKQTNKQINK